MDILSNAEQRMNKAISNFQDAIAVLRTGRANAALLENIECDYYGDRMNITSIAAIKVPEPRQLLIVPYDQGDIKTIVAAINASDIGINIITPFESHDKMFLFSRAVKYGVFGKNGTCNFFSCNTPVNGKPCGMCDDCKVISEMQSLINGG